MNHLSFHEFGLLGWCMRLGLCRTRDSVFLGIGLGHQHFWKQNWSQGGEPNIHEIKKNKPNGPSGARWTLIRVPGFFTFSPSQLLPGLTTNTNGSIKQGYPHGFLRHMPPPKLIEEATLRTARLLKAGPCPQGISRLPPRPGPSFPCHQRNSNNPRAMSFSSEKAPLWELLLCFPFSFPA